MNYELKRVRDGQWSIHVFREDYGLNCFDNGSTVSAKQCVMGMEAMCKAMCIFGR